MNVSIPSEFTLLSNVDRIEWGGFVVSIPSEFTLLSNAVTFGWKKVWFQYPLNLHCSQTIGQQIFLFVGFNTL